MSTKQKDEKRLSHFKLSERFTSVHIRPFFEDYIQAKRGDINKIFGRCIRGFYHEKNNGKYKMCEEGQITDKIFKIFFWEEFLPEIGINPGGHTAKKMEVVENVLIAELLTYYKEHTDTYGDFGKAYREGNSIYIEVNKYKTPDDIKAHAGFVKAKSV